MKQICFLLLLALMATLWLPVKGNLHAAGIKQIDFAVDHPPYLEDLTIRSEAGTLNLSLRVANPFDHELKNLLLNGVPQKIKLRVIIKVNTFNLYLIKFNRELKKLTFKHRIKYDNLKKMFTVTFSEQAKPFKTTSYKQAVKWASRFDSIPLLSHHELDPEHDYQIETQAVIRKTKLPFHLDYLFFFLSAWDRKSSCYTIDIPKRLIQSTSEL